MEEMIRKRLLGFLKIDCLFLKLNLPVEPSGWSRNDGHCSVDKAVVKQKINKFRN